MILAWLFTSNAWCGNNYCDVELSGHNECAGKKNIQFTEQYQYGKTSLKNGDYLYVSDKNFKIKAPTEGGAKIELKDDSVILTVDGVTKVEDGKINDKVVTVELNGGRIFYQSDNDNSISGHSSTGIGHTFTNGENHDLAQTKVLKAENICEEYGEILYENLCYSIDKDEFTATVCRYNDEAAFTDSLIIPESISSDGVSYFVTSIGSSTFQSSKINGSITFPSGLQTIGDRAFFFVLIWKL